MTKRYRYIRETNFDTAVSYCDMYGYEIFQIVPRLDWDFTANSNKYYISKEVYYLRKEINDKAETVEL